MPPVESNVLDRVILSWPKNLTDVTEVKPNGPRRSWIQLARVGQFVSKRYGKFEISKGDLSTMHKNFVEIFPKQPTELPIDYDHLSMDPKKPGDGIAAGWMKKVELREDGQELWAEVEWTQDGAARIEKQEYKFVSPSFVKNYTHKDGRKIGTTLLAAAITNHPFLEGMSALTLYNFSAMGDLAVSEKPKSAVHLAEVGQRVSVKDGDELTADERTQVFEVVSVVGDGDDAFVSLKTLDGTPYGWFRASQLEPSRILTEVYKQEATTMSTEHLDGEQATEKIIALANTLAKEQGMSLRDATIAAGKQLANETDAYHEQFRAGLPEPAAASRSPINLHRNPDEGFAELVTRISRERRIDLRLANRVVSDAFPDLAEAYARGETQ